MSKGLIVSFGGVVVTGITFGWLINDNNAPVSVLVVGILYAVLAYSFGWFLRGVYKC